MSGSSYTEEFNATIKNFMNAILSPLAKYVVDNISNLSETTEDELIHAFRETLELPRPVVQSTSNTMMMNIASMAPNVNMIGNPGMSNIAVKDTTRKPRTVKKDAPMQVWLTVDDYMSQIGNGAFLCSYVSSRSKDHKDMVCAAKVEENTDADFKTWRCTTCKGKAGEIDKKLKNMNIQGIQQDRVIPGLNVLNNSPRLPMPTFTLPPKPNALGMPTIPTPNMLPTLPTLPTLPSMPALPKPITPVKVPEPVAEIKEKKNPQLISHLGLESGHYLASDADLKNFLFEFNKEKQCLNVIGKFNETLESPAPSNYKTKLVELSADEQILLNNYNSLVYKFTPVIAALPTLPVLPTLPNLPMIPGFN